jgi:hypothetical protein
MRKVICILFTAFCLIGCENKTSKICNNTSQDTILFLERPIVDNDSIYEQIAAIADEDEMLSYSDSVLKIGEVGWGINVGGPRLHITLLTSVQPEAPEMKQVVQYLIGIYGEPFDNCEGDDEYIDLIWPAYNDSTTINKGSARLRRIKGEEGGTVLF